MWGTACVCKFGVWLGWALWGWLACPRAARVKCGEADSWPSLASLADPLIRVQVEHGSSGADLLRHSAKLPDGSRTQINDLCGSSRVAPAPPSPGVREETTSCSTDILRESSLMSRVLCKSDEALHMRRRIMSDILWYVLKPAVNPSLGTNQHRLAGQPAIDRFGVRMYLLVYAPVVCRDTYPRFRTQTPLP